MNTTHSERFARLTSTDHIRASLRTHSVRAAAFTWIAGAGDFALRLGSTAVLARLVLPEHFGLVMMVMAVTSIADQFRDLGLSTVTVQRAEITHDEISNLFWINVLSGVLIAVVVSAAAPLMAMFYREPRVILPACVLSINFIWGGLMVQHQALLTRQLRLGYTSVVRFIASLVSTLLAVALAWKGFGYWALVWREFARCALLTVGMWACFPWVPGLPNRRVSVSNLIRFGAHLSLANIVASISGGIDRFLLGRFWGPESTAMYRQAYQTLVLPVEQLVSPVYQVTQPGLSILQADPSRFRAFYGKVLTLACVAAMPLSLFVAVHSAEITRVMLGRRWLTAGPLLLILSFSSFIKQPIGSTAFVLIAQGRSKAYLVLSLLQNATLMICMCVGVYWGATGIAVAEVVATYLFLLPRVHYTFKDSTVTTGWFLSTMARPAAASIVMAGVLEFLHQSLPAIGAPAILIVGGATGAAVFFGTWIALPGGARQIADLVQNVQSAFQKKVRAIEPVPAANETAAS